MHFTARVRVRVRVVRGHKNDRPFALSEPFDILSLLGSGVRVRARARAS